MSADNFIAIQKRDGKYYVWMDFMSNDNPEPNARSWEFLSEHDAEIFAEGWEHGEEIVEYGIKHLPNYVTPKITGKYIYDMANINISNAADHIRKNIEGCTLFGIPIDMNNANHLIVAAHQSGFMKLLKQNEEKIK